MSEHRKHLDPRDPWVVNIHELVRRPGEMLEWRRELPAPEGVGIELIRVPADSPVEIDVRLESVREGVLATGTATADLVGECARCLGPVTDRRAFDLQELYFYPGRDAEEGSLYIDEDQIDLEPPLRDAIVLELPFTPLCREDCLGLCPRCGFEMNSDPDHSHEPDIDPRWAVLQDLD